jgi:hypothetical protein
MAAVSSSSSSSSTPATASTARVLHSPSSDSEGADLTLKVNNGSPPITEFVPFDLEEGEIDGAKFTLAFPPALPTPTPLSTVSSLSSASFTSSLSVPTIDAFAALSPLSRIVGVTSPMPPVNPIVPWNNRLLLFAHGHRPLGTGLIADLGPTQEFYQHLLGEGWMIGMTSYRREGIVVEVYQLIKNRCSSDASYRLGGCFLNRMQCLIW